VSECSVLLSVLCLTYNHEAFVAQALASFGAQETSFEFEVIVADDCSTDGTLAIVESFRGRFGDRLRILTTPVNLGVTRNFRRALSACRGRYVALCEGDDYWRGSNKLQRQVDFLEGHADYVMAFHDATVIGATAASGQIQLPKRLRRDASSDELIATRSISTLTVCFRNVLETLPPELDHAPVLDLCLWSLLGHHGKGKYLGGIEPAVYRVHNGGVHSTQTEHARIIMLSQSLLALARLYARRGDLAAADRLQLTAVLWSSRSLGGWSLLRSETLAPAWWLLQRALVVRRKWFGASSGLPR
jgi:glycosyltransferase involved in cell wall biosynthesis